MMNKPVKHLQFKIQAATMESPIKHAHFARPRKLCAKFARVRKVCRVCRNVAQTRKLCAIAQTLHTCANFAQSRKLCANAQTLRTVQTLPKRALLLRSLGSRMGSSWGPPGVLLGFSRSLFGVLSGSSAGPFKGPLGVLLGSSSWGQLVVLLGSLGSFQKSWGPLENLRSSLTWGPLGCPF